MGVLNDINGDLVNLYRVVQHHLEEFVQQSATHLRLSQVYIGNLSWQDVIKHYDREHTFFYMDPPNWETAG